MKSTKLYIATLLISLASCSGGDDLQTKKEQLTELRTQAKELKERISALEKEISSEDTTAAAAAERNAVLVNLEELKPREFTHEIEVRGSVSSRTNVLLSAETGGRITSVKVSEGDNVTRGQVLVTLDNDVLQNNIQELRTSLELAEAVYERQANLWEKKIGTEIQYLEAKNRVESLQSRLKTANSQLDQAVLRAPFSGSVDQVPARVGEMAQPGMPLVRIMNKENMYINADVSERFISAFKPGDPVTVHFPVLDKTITSEIAAVSQVINQENRTFNVEVSLPKVDFTIKPNQVVILELTDYENPESLVVPTEVILSDAQGKYLYVASTNGEETRAQKAYIKPGRTQDGMTEILDGLEPSSRLIVEGYRDVNEGTLIKPTKASTETAKLN